jgi:glutamate dehydrogenase
VAGQRRLVHLGAESVTNAGEQVLSGLGANERSELSSLILGYLRHIAIEDLTGDASEVVASILHHRELASRRSAGRANVAIRQERASSVLLVVTDDMPFLVDSVTAAITASHRNIESVFHPQLVVHRTLDGALTQISGALEENKELGDGLIAESWMRFELAPASAEQDDLLISRVTEVLRDVREAVEDWGKMRHRALSLAETLEHGIVGISAEESSDGVELLRWLAGNHFTFLGYRQYRLQGDSLLAQPGTGLGILRDDPTLNRQRPLPAEVAEHARDPELLILTKANSRSTVHRPAHLDYVGVKIFDESGKVIGEHRFLGLFAATAYISSVTTIPVLRRKVDQVLQLSEFPRASHSGKDLIQVLETFPRDELFQVGVQELFETTLAVLRLQERRQTRVFLREDRFSRFVSALVYLPRDRYTTAARNRVEGVLLESFGGESIDYSAHVTESVLARLHFVVRMPEGVQVPHYSIEKVQERVAAAVREWSDALVEAILALPADKHIWVGEYEGAFSEAFKSDFSVDDALLEVEALDRLDGISAELREDRFLLRSDQPIAISDLLPLLTDFGVTVLEERPYPVRARSANAWIYALHVEMQSPFTPELKARFEEAFLAVWNRNFDRDALNQLVVTAALNWREVAVIRGYLRYVKQGGLPFSAQYLEECLVQHADVSSLLYDLFASLHDPKVVSEEKANEIRLRLYDALDRVRVLDEDRILRAVLGSIEATLRTNAFTEHQALAFKLDSQLVPELPNPRPALEIWVTSPTVEGIHLRFGAVARGGLRWSDRREDFRTEVLGLVKAQMVKNAVIVPVGAKGGFVVRRPTDSTQDRAAWLAEGIAAYRIFIESLLDLTDNRSADGSIVPPAGIIRRDHDDPYLVVAADKGTATFSDIANEISVRRGFWLGDAFASGGSYGYDHKGMGITARGAWISVEHHFREMGLDPATDPITTVGIGDMSGDVFGNGMLLSRSLKLVAAFDHRHIFLDPNPDPSASFKERERLFALERSSWADYRSKLISKGGGVWSRTDKSIPLSVEVRTLLGLPDDVTELAPHLLIAAILTARVDLLWNGGIGTYVKASVENNSDVGDKANDALRVNGKDLHCRVVGEGGNLGFTQRGRIEYALNGGMINTDAIDNSAGVDTSDHEVNLKILFAPLIQSGKLSFEERNSLLASMTDEVAQAVLADNRAQNFLLGTAFHQATQMFPVHRRMLPWLGREAGLDRAVEALPTESECNHRAAEGRGLTRSELAVLAAYLKILITREVQNSSLPDDPWWNELLHQYFPTAVRERFPQEINEHPLRREIISMMIANEVVNHGGITMLFRIQEETSAPLADIVRAYTIACGIFDAQGFLREINSITSPALRYQSLIEHRRLIERAARWLVPWQRMEELIAPAIEPYRQAAEHVRDRIALLLQGSEAGRFQREIHQWTTKGLDPAFAEKVAGLLDSFSALDISDISRELNASIDEVASVYFTLSELFDIDALLLKVTQLPRTDRWDSLARSSMRADLYAALADLTRSVLRSSAHSLADWQRSNGDLLSRVRGILDEVRASEVVDLALLSVALRTIRGLLARHRG